MLSVLTFRTPEEAVDEGQQHPVRALGRRLDREGQPDPVDGRSSCGPASSGPTRSTGSTRPARSAATRSPGYGREGGRHGLGGVPRCLTAARPRPRVRRLAPPSRARRPQDLQALHRRRVPALGVGPLLRGAPTPTASFLANAALASRKDARDAVVAAREAFAGWAGRDGLQPRPGALPGRRGAGGPARRSSPPRCAPPRASRRPRRGGQVDAAIDRWVWYAGLGRQDRPGGRRRQPGRRAVLQLLACPSRPASSPWSRRRTPACSGWSAWSRR